MRQPDNETFAISKKLNETSSQLEIGSAINDLLNYVHLKETQNKPLVNKDIYVKFLSNLFQNEYFSDKVSIISLKKGDFNDQVVAFEKNETEEVNYYGAAELLLNELSSDIDITSGSLRRSLVDYLVFNNFEENALRRIAPRLNITFGMQKNYSIQFRQNEGNEYEILLFDNVTRQEIVLEYKNQYMAQLIERIFNNKISELKDLHIFDTSSVQNLYITTLFNENICLYHQQKFTQKLFTSNTKGRNNFIIKYLGAPKVSLVIDEICKLQVSGKYFLVDSSDPSIMLTDPMDFIQSFDIPKELDSIKVNDLPILPVSNSKIRVRFSVTIPYVNPAKNLFGLIVEKKAAPKNMKQIFKKSDVQSALNDSFARKTRDVSASILKKQFADLYKQKLIVSIFSEDQNSLTRRKPPVLDTGVMSKKIVKLQDELEKKLMEQKQGSKQIASLSDSIKDLEQQTGFIVEPKLLKKIVENKFDFTKEYKQLDCSVFFYELTQLQFLVNSYVGGLINLDQFMDKCDSILLLNPAGRESTQDPNFVIIRNLMAYIQQNYYDPDLRKLAGKTKLWDVIKTLYSGQDESVEKLFSTNNNNSLKVYDGKLVKLSPIFHSFKTILEANFENDMIKRNPNKFYLDPDKKLIKFSVDPKDKDVKDISILGLGPMQQNLLSYLATQQKAPAYTSDIYHKIVLGATQDEISEKTNNHSDPDGCIYFAMIVRNVADEKSPFMIVSNEYDIVSKSKITKCSFFMRLALKDLHDISRNDHRLMICIEVVLPPEEMLVKLAANNHGMQFTNVTMDTKVHVLNLNPISKTNYNGTFVYSAPTVISSQKPFMKRYFDPKLYKLISYNTKGEAVLEDENLVIKHVIEADLSLKEIDERVDSAMSHINNKINKIYKIKAVANLDNSDARWSRRKYSVESLPEPEVELPDASGIEESKRERQ